MKRKITSVAYYTIRRLTYHSLWELRKSGGFFKHKKGRGRIVYIMTMNDLRRGDRAVVLKVELPVLLKERLRAVGIFTGSKLLVLKVSGKKNVRLVQAGSAKIALDGETAAGIKIWQI